MMHGEAHTIRDVYVDGPLERRSFGGERDSMDAHQRRLRLDFEQLVLLSVADHRFQRLVHAIRANVVVTLEHRVERRGQIARQEHRKQICGQVRTFQRQRLVFDIAQTGDVVDHRMLAGQFQQPYVGRRSRGDHGLQHLRRDPHALPSCNGRQRFNGIDVTFQPTVGHDDATCTADLADDLMGGFQYRQRHTQVGTADAE